jgi:hypothetical protein
MEVDEEGIRQTIKRLLLAGMNSQDAITTAASLHEVSPMDVQKIFQEM